MAWLLDNWALIAGIAGAVLALAAIIVKLTPTPIDDVVVDVLRKLLGMVPVRKAEAPAAPPPSASVLGGETKAPLDKGSSTDAKVEKLPLDR